MKPYISGKIVFAPFMTDREWIFDLHTANERLQTIIEKQQAHIVALQQSNHEKRRVIYGRTA